MKTTDDEELLKRRFWVMSNLEWLMGEVGFHKDNDLFFRNDKIDVWKLDTPEGKATIK